MQKGTPYPPVRVLWRFVLESLSRPVLVLDQDGLLVEANRAARESDIAELTHLFEAESDERVLALLAALRKHGSGSTEIELGDGASPRTLLLEGFAVESWHVVIVNDRSGELARDEELRQLRRVESVSLLAAGAAHDLNNLLTPILCLSSMLKAELDADSRAAELAAEVEASAVRAASLVRDVLAFARPAQRRVMPVNLSWVVSGMRALIERVLGDGVELELSLEAELGSAIVDRAAAEHALLNLVTNARQAMPRGGHLLITTENVRGASGAAASVGLAVIDNGIGMSDEVRKSAFQRFFTTRDAEGGTGLGLASVQRFVTESRGTLSLESAPGAGTAVKLTLPRAEPGASSTSTDTTRELRGGRETVLVIDRDDQVRRTVRLVLEARGYRVLDAPSGEGGLRIAERAIEGVRLALVDATLAQRDVTLLEKLRGAAANAKIVLMTGDHHAEVSGGDTHALRKAFSEHDLTKTVRCALEQD
jgi:signal transduction histidine kinase